MIRLIRRWWPLAWVVGILSVVAAGLLLGTNNRPNSPARVAIARPTAQETLPTTPNLTAILVNPSLPQAMPSVTSTSAPAYFPTTIPWAVEPGAESAPDQFVIQFNKDTTEEQREEYLGSINAMVEESIEELDMVVVTLLEKADEGPLPESAVVAASEPNYYLTALDFEPPDDPLFAEQWALPILGAPQVWSELLEDPSTVTVAVIDSGVCADHPDLEGRIEAGWDFLEDDGTPQDEFGHGCAVTGVIAANTDNGIGIAGVAPNAQIMPLRVLNAQGVGTYSNLAAAIVYAADNGAEVINLSLGGPNRSATLEQAVNYAKGQGVILVAAAGNTGQEGVLYPAAYESVIAVGSVEPNLQRSQFSSYGPEIDLLAPGRDIWTTASDGGYRVMSGTSFAAVHVSAVASLEIARGATLTQSGGVISVLSFAESSIGPAEPVAAYVRQVRTLDTGEIGVPNPVGLAYLPQANTLQVVEAREAGGRLGGFSDIKQITLVEEPAGSVRIAAGLSDPLNIAFDVKANRLLIFQVSDNQLIEILVGPGGQLDPTTLTRYDAQRFNIENPLGMTVDPVSGHLFILDGAGPRLIRVESDPSQGFRNAVIFAVDLPSASLINVRGLAFDPNTRNLHLFTPVEQELIELTQTGQLVATRDLSELQLRDPQGMVFAPSGDLTDDPMHMNLYLADSGANGGQQEPGRIIELSFSEPVQLVRAASFQATLVQIIDGSQWSPPSPDPAGIVYLPASNTLLISDSEVNEQPPIFTGDNLFEATLTGNLLDTLTTISFSKEPTGITLNPANGHLFISDDNKKLVFEMNPGPDGLYDTQDDVITSFSTTDFGSFDPEGVTFASGSGFLYVTDGVNEEIYRVAPGLNGVFDGVPPAGDDQVASFDTTSLGLIDPEGIAFNSDNGNLYIVGQPKTTLFEVTTGGTLVQTIDISEASAKKPAGLAYAPGSQNPNDRNIYIAARGKDNFNDGKIYELTLPSSNTGTPVPTNTPTPTDTAGPSPTSTPTDNATITPTPLPPTATPTAGATSPPGSMPAVDAVSSGTTSGSSLTLSHTTSGAGRLMLAGVSINNANFETVSSITYSGVPLTRVGYVDHLGSGDNDSRVEIWKLVAPPEGTADVVITFSADLKLYAVGGVITFTGVDPFNPLGGFVASYGNTSSPSLSVPSASDERVLGVFACETCASVTFSGAAVQHWNLLA
ncbi:MAG: S8 family serine peptidase, partial [Chloroflexi bacterium]|nr:S8 family serine peptidase [Chloroflexota bacterium]